MAVLYMVAAWLIMQVAEVIIGLANLPEWIGPTVLILLAVGLPIALILSWFYELTPEGLSLETDIDGTEAVTRVNSRRLDFLVIALLCAAVILFAYDKWWIPGPSVRSIAVLPFENLSLDPEQDYFSDGISEEILNRMIPMRGIRVISRTSSFAYRGSSVDIRDVGRQLGADYILQGTVRRAVDVVRISVRLTDTSDGTEVWANSYDKELTDILSVQDEIAVSAIKGFAPSITLEPSIQHNINPKAYEAYLRGNEYFNRGLGDPSIDIAVELYERAVDLDPTFVMSHVALAKAHSRMVIQGIDTTQERKDQAKASIEAALRLDRELPAVLAAQGWYYYWALSDYDSALEWFELALEQLPNDSELLLGLGLAERRLARWDDALRHLLLSFGLDPLSNEKAIEVGVSYAYKHDHSEAIKYFETAVSLAPDQYRAYAHLAAALVGRDRTIDGALQALRNGGDVLGRSDFIRRMLSPQPSWLVQTLMLRAFPEDLKNLESESLTNVQTVYYLVLIAEQHRRDRRTDSKREAAEKLLRLAGIIPNRFDQFVGLAHAHLDQREEATRLLTVSPELMKSNARIYQEYVMIEAYGQLLLGNHDAAIARLDHALSVPGSSSVALILVSSLWDDLQYHTGFHSLFEKYEY
ncbi:MAG: tetratricopeptide repeat protein [Gammaproteobacteria bacterium]